MKFSLKSLFVAILSIALLCTSFRYAPMATLSVILLGFLPTLAYLTFRMRSQRKMLLAHLSLAPLAVYGFYVGMLGPLVVLAAGPEDWGFVSARTAIFDFMSWAYTPTAIMYPFLFFDPECEMAATKNILKLLENYQNDWLSFFIMEN